MAGSTTTTTARSSNPPVLLTDTKVASLKPPADGQEEHRDLKVTGLRLRIGAGGKKTWIVRARAGEKIVNKKLGNYPAMGLGPARIAAEKLLTALARDRGTEGIDRTFGSVAETWIDKVAKPKNRSWRLQERRLELHVLPKWKDKKIAEIRRGDVRDLIEGLEGDVLPNMVLALVRPIFRFALSRDWIEASPAEGIEKPKAEKSRERVLSEDEIVRIWRATELLGYPFRQYVQTLLLTAQRRTEVASMRWEAVDLDAGTWTLQASETKSKRAHLVPLSKPVVESLKAMPRFGDFVFSTDGESHMSGYAKVKRKLDEFIGRDKGREMPGWTFHDFRRTASTHMVRLGILEEVVGKVLNHAAQGVTAKVYALHRYEPEKRSALDRWAAEVMRLVAGKAEGNVVELRPAS
jgi:integrase